jgi:sulfur relay (sulfurtransferase) DsrC/TusE family protein
MAFDLTSAKPDGEEGFDLSTAKSGSEPAGPGVSASGIATEAAKGLARGASETGLAVGDVTARALLGPIAGPLASTALRTLVRPSTELVSARPANEPERFAGTAGEILGASAIGGGMGTTRGILTTGAAALSGAAGEQAGGKWGQLAGVLLGAGGTALATKVLSQLGATSADIAATLGAAFGNKAGTERLATKAVTELAGDSAAKIKEALKKPGDFTSFLLGEFKNDARAALTYAEERASNLTAAGFPKQAYKYKEVVKDLQRERPAGFTEYIPGAKVSAGEAITEAQMGKPEQFGGALVRLQKDLYGAHGVEDILPTMAKEQKASVKNYLKALTEKTTPMREKALEAANKKGVDPDLITAKIDEALTRPVNQGSELITKTLSSVKDKINSLINEKTGTINAEALYSKRKELGNTIAGFSKETSNWDRKVAAYLERNIQKWMDDAIEKAGGIGWKDYLATESTGRKAVDNFLARQKEMKLLAAGVKGQSIVGMVPGEIPKPPTLLHRGAMFANYFLGVIARDANLPVVKRVAEAMRDPNELQKLIKLPQSHPDKQAYQRIAAILAGMAKPDQPVSTEQALSMLGMNPSQSNVAPVPSERNQRLRGMLEMQGSQ